MAIFPLTQKELRIIQVLFVLPVLIGIGIYALAGNPIGEAVLGGGVMGGLYFIPLALIYFLYLFWTDRSVQDE